MCYTTLKVEKKSRFSEVYDSYVGTNVMTASNIHRKPLSQTITKVLTAGYVLSMDRDYKFAYVSNGIVNIEHGTSLNYVEALSVLIAAGYLNGLVKPSGMTVIDIGKFTPAMNNLLNKIKGLNISSKLIGVYTPLEEDAAKLAYACGGFFKKQFISENHDITKGSGHYYHFHDVMHLIHVFYGNPS